MNGIHCVAQVEDLEHAGATLPQFRGAGVHAALIAERIRIARDVGCSLVSGQADWGSISQRNQQRAGLVLSHVKAVWHNGTTQA